MFDEHAPSRLTTVPVPETVPLPGAAPVAGPAPDLPVVLSESHSSSLADGSGLFQETPQKPVVAMPQDRAPQTPSDDDTSLIPARMLNEFTYCPRLGYLEWVQGEWAENLETMQGTFGHRNCDKPDRRQFAAPEKSEPDSAGSAKPEGGPVPPENVDGEAIHARSLMLSAPLEGLIAKCDVLEIEGHTATPVDYKRGTVPDIPGNAYDPERVQLCAQGLILRENGFACHEGVLYFIGSRRRVTIPFDDDLIALTRQKVVEFKATAEAGRIPPPLIDSPKCPRCSLVGICLPDEINWLRSSDHDVNLAAIERADDEPDPSGLPDGSPPIRIPAGPPDGLRRLLPASSDAFPLYVQEQGAFVGKSGERITVSQKGKELQSVKLIDVSQLCLYGNVSLSSALVRELSFRGIPVCYLTYGGWFNAMTTGLVHRNVELRIQQYAIASDPLQSLRLARQIISGKIRNSRTLLRRHLDDKRHPALRRLHELRQQAESASSAATLLGLEGMAAKEYFKAFFTLLPDRIEFDVSTRNRRPPKDPVNAVLSLVYSLLVKELAVTLQAVGFDPMLGIYHRPRYGRPSLALDLAEEFRPIIGDSVTLTVFNNGEVSPSSFLSRAGAVTLTEAGRKAVFAAFERRMASEVTHPVFGYVLSYRRVLEVQSRLLARVMLSELDEYPSFCTR